MLSSLPQQSLELCGPRSCVSHGQLLKSDQADLLREPVLLTSPLVREFLESSAMLAAAPLEQGWGLKYLVRYLWCSRG